MTQEQRQGLSRGKGPLTMRRHLIEQLQAGQQTDETAAVA
jgi:hypothetical protein